jgi:hypothetical protein
MFVVRNKIASDTATTVEIKFRKCQAITYLHKTSTSTSTLSSIATSTSTLSSIAGASTNHSIALGGRDIIKKLENIQSRSVFEYLKYRLIVCWPPQKRGICFARARAVSSSPYYLLVDSPSIVSS